MPRVSRLLYFKMAAGLRVQYYSLRRLANRSRDHVVQIYVDGSMTGVRGKKSQRQKRANTTRPGLKRKKKEKKVKVLK